MHPNSLKCPKLHNVIPNNIVYCEKNTDNNLSAELEKLISSAIVVAQYSEKVVLAKLLRIALEINSES